MFVYTGVSTAAAVPECSETASSLRRRIKASHTACFSKQDLIGAITVDVFPLGWK